MSDSDEPLDLVDEGDDLFGDEDDAGGSPNAQVLSDKDLDSDAERGNDVGGYGSDDEAPRHQDKVIASIQVFRHRAPKSKDGTVSIRLSQLSLALPLFSFSLFSDGNFRQHRIHAHAYWSLDPIP